MDLTQIPLQMVLFQVCVVLLVIVTVVVNNFFGPWDFGQVNKPKWQVNVFPHLNWKMVDLQSFKQTQKVREAVQFKSALTVTGNVMNSW